MTKANNDFWADAEVISSYTRAQAIEDGQLIDVSTIAREAGLKFPVAITQAAWSQYVTVPREPFTGFQDEQGRLWDIVWMLRCAARRADGDQITVKFLCVVDSPAYVDGGMHAWKEAEPSPCKLKALCHGGDNAEPVITLMLPEED